MGLPCVHVRKQFIKGIAGKDDTLKMRLTCVKNFHQVTQKITLLNQGTQLPQNRLIFLIQVLLPLLHFR